MIAPAMTSRKREPSTYRELARNEVTLTKGLDPAAFPRMSGVGELVEPVQVQASFFLHQQKPAVNCSFEARICLPCQWCDAQLARNLKGQFAARLAVDEDEARRWHEEGADEVTPIVAGESVDLVLVVEDELLLHVPDRVCEDESCERRPVRDYGEVVTESKPLSGLRELLRNQQDRS